MDRHSKALALLHTGTVIPAIPLALDENRRFDEEGQRRLVRYYLHAGTGGVAVAVHTTQFEIRKPGVDLLRPVLEAAVTEIRRYEQETGRTCVRVAGVCGPIGQAVSEAELARSLGYDAVLLSPGGLEQYPDEYLVERTKAVAAVMPVIGFYLQQACGGRYLPYDYWKQVADIPNVAAVKCASFNRYQTLDLVRGVAASERREEVALYTGNDDNILIDLLTEFQFEEDGVLYKKRFVGGLLGHWSLWSHTVTQLFEEVKQYQDGRPVPARLLTLAQQITDCNGAFFDAAHNFAGCIPGVHYVLHRQGLMKGLWCLDSDETLSPGQEEEIERVYRMYPHLNDDAFVRDFLQNDC